MKLKIVLITAVFLSVLLQLSVFFGWSLVLFGGPVSPQIFVVLAVFLLFEFSDDYVWYFTFFYYLFYDLITRPAFPGLSAFLVLLALLAIKLLRGRIFKKSVFTNLLFFILFSAFYFVVSYHKLPPPLIVSQVLINLVMLIIFYPFLYVVYKFLKSNTTSQLSLKI